MQVLFSLIFVPYPEACIFIADGRHLHHGHCYLLSPAAKSVPCASRGTLGYLGEAQAKNGWVKLKRNGERKGETGQTFAENSEIYCFFFLGS